MGILLAPATEPADTGACFRALGCFIPDVGGAYIAPAKGALGGGPRGIDGAQGNLPALGLVGLQQARSALARQCSRQLPRDINRIADTGIHPQTAVGDDKMGRVPGNEGPAHT